MHYLEKVLHQVQAAEEEGVEEEKEQQQSLEELGVFEDMTNEEIENWEYVQ